jgi:IS5 family transposase
VNARQTGTSKKTVKRIWILIGQKKKNNQSYFGYKNHIKVDVDSKLIVDYAATSANVHDNQVYGELVVRLDEVVYGDSA